MGNDSSMTLQARWRVRGEAEDADSLRPAASGYDAGSARGDVRESATLRAGGRAAVRLTLPRLPLNQAPQRTAAAIVTYTATLPLAAMVRAAVTEPRRGGDLSSERQSQT